MKRFSLLLCLLLLASLCRGIPTEKLYLSGTGADDTRTWDFFCSAGQRSGRWTSIQVPSCWEQQGFGTYTYGRFYKTPGEKPGDECGRYRTWFTVPSKWKGKHIELIFEGVMTDAEVWLDGRRVGTHQGAFTQFSFDVTPFVRAGHRHRLEVIVHKESSNPSVNSAERRADWWLFGGIYRPVFLEAKPATHIRHAVIDARCDGHLSARVFTSRAEGKELKVRLDGLAPERQTVTWNAADSSFLLEASFAGVSPWNPEHPALHKLTMEVGDHEADFTVGFRTVEFRRGDGLYLNGTKLLVKGTNRHCFHPDYGRTLSYALSLEDALLIKKMNMNAVRCHYPSDSHFLSVCDSLGLLYLDEFPGWQTRYDDTTALRLLPEFIFKDVNHPCVFLWSNGNEGGWNTVVDTLFTQYDIQKRKVVHPWADFDGIDTHHYPAYQTGTYRMHKGRNVFLPTEFLHGQYDKGQGAALEDFWNHWTASPLFAGGFLWAFVDEAVRRTDLPTGKSAGKHFGEKGFDLHDCLLDSDGTNGPDGCLNAYRSPEGSFFTIREVWSPIYLDGLCVTPGFDGRLPVENRYLFTSLESCSMTWTVKKYSNGLLQETSCGKVDLPPTAPGEKRYARFALPENFRDNDVLEIRAFGPSGEEVCTWSAPIPHEGRSDEMTLQAKGKRRISVDFNAEGVIKCVKSDGDSLPFLEGPFPVGMLASSYREQERTESDGTWVKTFWYRGGFDSIQWKVTPDGRLLMDATLLNSDRGHGFQGSFLTREGEWTLGLTFRYPQENVDSVRWMGRGPYRVWRNREKGNAFGLWSKCANTTVTGQYGSPTPPLYPEFQGYHADVRWMEFFGKSHFRVTSGTESLYVRLFTPSEPVGKEGQKVERTMVPFPEGDISFLLSIPPIRSYKPLEQQGPMSQPDNIRIKPGDEGFHLRLSFSL